MEKKEIRKSDKKLVEMLFVNLIQMTAYVEGCFVRTDHDKIVQRNYARNQSAGTSRG